MYNIDYGNLSFLKIEMINNQIFTVHKVDGEEFSNHYLRERRCVFFS
jgi:hypothetical protein